MVVLVFLFAAEFEFVLGSLLIEAPIWHDREIFCVNDVESLINWILKFGRNWWTKGVGDAWIVFCFCF